MKAGDENAKDDSIALIDALGWLMGNIVPLTEWEVWEAVKDVVDRRYPQSLKAEEEYREALK